MPPKLGSVSDQTNMTSLQQNNSQVNNTSDAFSKKAQPNNSGWTALWPQEQHNVALSDISLKNPVSSNGFTSSIAPSNKNVGSVFSSASNNPVNPFTGTEFKMFLGTNNITLCPKCTHKNGTTKNNK